jgi:hypothetical protein
VTELKIQESAHGGILGQQEYALFAAKNIDLKVGIKNIAIIALSVVRFIFLKRKSID